MVFFVFYIYSNFNGTLCKHYGVALERDRPTLATMQQLREGKSKCIFSKEPEL